MANQLNWIDEELRIASLHCEETNCPATTIGVCHEQTIQIEKSKFVRKPSSSGSGLNHLAQAIRFGMPIRDNSRDRIWNEKNRRRSRTGHPKRHTHPTGFNSHWNSLTELSHWASSSSSRGGGRSSGRLFSIVSEPLYGSLLARLLEHQTLPNGIRPENGKQKELLDRIRRAWTANRWESFFCQQPRTTGATFLQLQATTAASTVHGWRERENAKRGHRLIMILQQKYNCSFFSREFSYSNSLLSAALFAPNAQCVRKAISPFE